MNIFTSIFLTLVMIFGFGPKGATLSRQYQSGAWDGSRVGIFETAEVRDGILYIGNEPSDYPADSSKNYYMPSIYSSEKGTWFADSFSAYKFDLVMRFDKRGQNIKTIDFRQKIGNDAKYVEVKLSNDRTVIEVIIHRTDSVEICPFSVDPDVNLQYGSGS